MSQIVFTVIIAAVALAAVCTATPLVQSDSRIVGGVDARPEEFPHICSLQAVWFLTSNHVCSVNIISNRLVLTAGSCVERTPFLGRFEVLCGQLNLVASIDPSQQRVRVSEITIHPEYNVTANDIALVRLYT